MGDGVRLDVWLDVACVVKTRSQAKELCDGGKVEVNGQRAKPHRLVRCGDRLLVALAPGQHRELKIVEVLETHVQKARARELYEDLTPPPTPEELETRHWERLAPPPAPPRGAGRPEKRDRRKIERFRAR